MAQNEHLILLIKREGKIVLGKHFVNLWLLAAVLVATFVSVAFSNGSLLYLNEKMNDPFTNWVNIENKQNAAVGARDALGDIEIQQHYGYNDIQADQEMGLLMLRHNSDNTDYCQTRFFEHMQSPLMAKVLSEENVVGGSTVHPESLQDEMLGFIITKDALLKMGYSVDSIPPFINYFSASFDIDKLISNGIIYDRDIPHYPAPMPVLAVVKRLPMNMSMVASKYVLGQLFSSDYVKPLSMTHDDYFRKLVYFVSEGKENEFLSKVDAFIPDSLRRERSVEDIVLPIEDESLQARLQTWKAGRFYQICIGERDTPIDVYEDVAAKIEPLFSDIEVCRVFDYLKGDGAYGEFSFLSLSFTTLDSIRSFEAFVKEKYNVQVEMSQVNSKENFNAVSVMANILSWAMIVFAIVCIIIFLVNMLHSYFQKVKRNLGTFKAFGISSAELTQAYVLIILAIVLSAVIIALLLTNITQAVLPWLGIMKDGTFNYLSLWGTNTVMAIIIIIASTLLTVILVLRQLMKQTPGDLIYDRN